MADDSLTLLRRLSEGDPDAAARLLHAHLPGLRAYVRLHSDAVLRAKESSMDLVQDVCVEILAHLDRFRYPSENAFKHWLYATALREVRRRYEFHTAQKRDAARELRLSSDASRAASGAHFASPDVSACYARLATPSQQLASREECERIERAFDELPEDYREVLLQARLLRASPAEIAEQLGRSPGAVRTLLYRAQARLAALLADDPS